MKDYTLQEKIEFLEDVDTLNPTGYWRTASQQEIEREFEQIITAAREHGYGE